MLSLRIPATSHATRRFIASSALLLGLLGAQPVYACQLVCMVIPYTLSGAADTDAARNSACNAAQTGFKQAKPGFLAALPGSTTIFTGAKGGDPCFDLAAASSAGGAAGKASLHSIAVGFGGWGGSLASGEAAYASAYASKYAETYGDTRGDTAAANAAANSAGIAASAVITGIAAGTSYDYTNATNSAAIAAAAFAAAEPGGKTGGVCAYSNNKLTCCNM